MNNVKPIKTLGEIPDPYFSKVIKNLGDIRTVDGNILVVSAPALIKRGLVGRRVTVGTTPTLILNTKFPKAFSIINPSPDLSFTASGSINTGLLIASAVHVIDGNTQLAPIDSSNYRDCHIFLDVTASAGAGQSMDIELMTYDPIGLKWYPVQALFANITATGQYYANTGNIGLATNFAVRWLLSGVGPSFTFSMSYVLKDSLPGLNSVPNLARTIYIGPESVTTQSGYPLLTGGSKDFYALENVNLYAIANVVLDINIFDL